MRRILAPPESMPVIGKHRERSAFLWVPKTINLEWRWLEYATWLEQYVDAFMMNEEPYWIAVEWRLA